VIEMAAGDTTACSTPKNGGKAGSERDLFVFHRNPASVQQTVPNWTDQVDTRKVSFSEDDCTS
jgi:hypothetical protein